MTHNPRAETIDMYTTFTWEAKCREVLKLKLDLPPHDEPAGPDGVIEPVTSTAMVRTQPAGVLATSFATRAEEKVNKQETLRCGGAGYCPSP